MLINQHDIIAKNVFSKAFYVAETKEDKILGYYLKGPNEHLSKLNEEDYVEWQGDFVRLGSVTI
jgi:hypothetical protein